MNNVSLFIIFLFFLKPSFSQYEFDTDVFIKGLVGEVRSDRPGQALSAKTCGFLTAQIQSGFSSERSFYTMSNLKRYTIPTQVKLGLSNNFEINTGFTYAAAKNYLGGAGSIIESNGFLSPELGFRYTFLKGKQWIPFMAIQSNIRFKSASNDFQQPRTGSSFYLATSNAFNKFQVSTNLGMIFSGYAVKKPQFTYVLNLSYQLGKKVSVFVEGFGDLKNPSLKGDAGISVALGQNFILDAFAGWLGELEREHWFAEIGFAYRLSFLGEVAKKKAIHFNK